MWTEERVERWQAEVEKIAAPRMNRIKKSGMRDLRFKPSGLTKPAPWESLPAPTAPPAPSDPQAGLHGSLTWRTISEQDNRRSAKIDSGTREVALSPACAPGLPTVAQDCSCRYRRAGVDGRLLVEDIGTR